MRWALSHASNCSPTVVGTPAVPAWGKYSPISKVPWRIRSRISAARRCAHLTLAGVGGAGTPLTVSVGLPGMKVNRMDFGRISTPAPALPTADTPAC
jgi:hypothetical protein